MSEHNFLTNKTVLSEQKTDMWLGLSEELGPKLSKLKKAVQKVALII